ncbi:hypothetical protein RM550_26230 [Streptomyces sp. DSM 41527]|uniref:DUF8175 domain-containing protein n=1 Tax=Streptomyces mooreae TaxID=3075523 RepID=A0ABU2TE03_9ACTN|nr:hypothetical protein [Streptomyces sp. DSM 41527]MDT0459173.1 hypothetical protein [Streptomyces sp. DSM 41527]
MAPRTRTDRSGPARWGIAAGTVTALTTVAIGVSVTTGNTSTAPTTPSEEPQHPPTTTTAARVTDGVPVGYSRTEPGAKAAAANFVIVRGSVGYLTSAPARHRALAVMNAEGADRGTVTEADKEADKAAKELHGGAKKADSSQAISRTGVLSSRALAFDIHRAAIRLWTTTVRGNASSHSSPHLAFGSVTVNLTWEHGDWKTDSMTSGTGLVAPLSPQQATNPAGDFSEYVRGKAKDPVLRRSTGAESLVDPYEHDAQGAAAAATNAVTLYGDPRFFTDTGWRHRMLRATAAPSVLASVTNDADSTAQLVTENRQLDADGRTADGGRLVTRTAVLATRVLSRSGQATSVELWTASVGGVAGADETADETERPQVAFQRMAVDLAWVNHTWKTMTVTQGQPLVPAPPAREQASPASSFADVGGVSDASALAG